MSLVPVLGREKLYAVKYSKKEDYALRLRG